MNYTLHLLRPYKGTMLRDSLEHAKAAAERGRGIEVEWTAVGDYEWEGRIVGAEDQSPAFAISACIDPAEIETIAARLVEEGAEASNEVIEAALKADGIPVDDYAVSDIREEMERLVAPDL